jgi:hypothetical protein
MATNYQFVKRYENFQGVDYKSSDLHFPELNATELGNVDFTQIGSIQKRKGYQAIAPSVGGCGIFTYRGYSATGAEEIEIIEVDTGLWRMGETTLSVVYSGVNSSAQISIFYDSASSQYRCRIQDGTTQVLDYALGVGVDEASPVTVANLITQINALTGFTASAVGPTTSPAAFLDIVPDHNLITSALSVTSRYWTSIYTPITLLPGNATYKNDIEFENTSGVQLQNCIYLSNGYDEVIKYDGHMAYRAGLPQPAAFQYTVSGNAAGFNGNNYSYKIQYHQIDHQGNEAEGNYVMPTDAATGSRYWNSGSNQQVSLPIPQVQSTTGFNTNCAIVNGNQTAVTTITVDTNGAPGNHTLQVGDTAYFYDAVSAGYVEREITARTTVSITIAGAAVTVTDNAVISNNLRVTVYRSKSTGSAAVFPTVWYKLAEFPNNSFSATSTIIDTTQDVNLGAIFIEPLTDRSPPVKGRYVSAFQNLMVTAGNLSDVNTVSVSDSENAEYFPVPDNQFLVNDIFGDKITGISPSNELFVVFQRRGIHVISGEIANGQFRVDQIANDVGCASHNSIRDIRGSLFFMSLSGPRVLQGGQIPQGLGKYEQNPYISRIDPVFDQADEQDEGKIYQLKRSIGFHDRIGQRYACFVPCESTTSGLRYANANSKVFVYDYQRDAWLEWTNMNMSGGVAALNDFIYFDERRFSSITSTIQTYTYKIHNTGTYMDYADNTSAIDAYWKSPWDFMGEASILKSFLAIRIFSTEEVENEYTISLKTERDWIKDTETAVTVDVGAGGYGVDRWDLDAYGSPADPTSTKKLNNNRVKALRVIFQNAEMQKNFLVSGYELEVAAPYKPRFVQ